MTYYSGFVAAPTILPPADLNVLTAPPVERPERPEPPEPPPPTYSLFGQAPPINPGAISGGTYTVGMVVDVTRSVTVRGLWFWSGAGLSSLPTWIGLFWGGQLVHGESGPTDGWSGAAGSGWVRAAFGGPPTISAGRYMVAVYGAGYWFRTSAWADYPPPIVSGPLSRPADMHNLGAYAADAPGPAYPVNSNPDNYHVELEAVELPAPPPGPFTIWNQSPPPGGSMVPGTARYTLGLRVQLARPVDVTGVWFWSPPAVDVLPDGLRVWDSASVEIGAETPVWSGPPASGWVRAPFSTPIRAEPPSMMVAVAGGGTTYWYGYTPTYWNTFPGVTVGPLSLPPASSSFYSLGDAYPTTFSAMANNWIDVEVYG